MIIAALALGYFATGVVYLLCYILVFKPQSGEAQLGLIVALWPVVILIDIVLSFATQLGKIGTLMQRKLASSEQRKTA